MAPQRRHFVSADSSGLPWDFSKSSSVECSRCNDKRSGAFRRCSKCAWGFCRNCFERDGFKHTCLPDLAHGEGPFPNSIQEAEILKLFEFQISPAPIKEPSLHNSHWKWNPTAEALALAPGCFLQKDELVTPNVRAALSSTCLGSQTPGWPSKSTTARCNTIRASAAVDSRIIPPSMTSKFSIKEVQPTTGSAIAPGSRATPTISDIANQSLSLPSLSSLPLFAGNFVTFSSHHRPTTSMTTSILPGSIAGSFAAIRPRCLQLPAHTGPHLDLKVQYENSPGAACRTSHANVAIADHGLPPSRTNTMERMAPRKNFSATPVCIDLTSSPPSATSTSNSEWMRSMGGSHISNPLRHHCQEVKKRPSTHDKRSHDMGAAENPTSKATQILEAFPKPAMIVNPSRTSKAAITVEPNQTNNPTRTDQLINTFTPTVKGLATKSALQPDPNKPMTDRKRKLEYIDNTESVDDVLPEVIYTARITRSGRRPSLRRPCTFLPNEAVLRTISVARKQFKRLHNLHHRGTQTLVPAYTQKKAWYNHGSWRSQSEPFRIGPKATGLVNEALAHLDAHREESLDVQQPLQSLEPNDSRHDERHLKRTPDSNATRIYEIDVRTLDTIRVTAHADFILKPPSSPKLVTGNMGEKLLQLQLPCFSKEIAADGPPGECPPRVVDVLSIFVARARSADSISGQR